MTYDIRYNAPFIILLSINRSPVVWAVLQSPVFDLDTDLALCA